MKPAPKQQVVDRARGASARAGIADENDRAGSTVNQHSKIGRVSLPKEERRRPFHFQKGNDRAGSGTPIQLRDFRKPLFWECSESFHDRLYIKFIRVRVPTASDHRVFENVVDDDDRA